MEQRGIIVVLVLSLLSLTYLVREVEGGVGGCYPITRGWGDGPGGVSLDEWWCNSTSGLLYGFLGFSYPMEDDDCNDYSYTGFVDDFKNMKSKFNATFVRAYLPACADAMMWVNMTKAARDTNMALIPMVFWDWQQNDPVMKKAENALLSLFTNSEVGSIAPYIVQSVAFGDELGEQGDYWVSRMSAFKVKLSKYNIPITITDDWDRPVYVNGSGLSSFGKEVNALSDMTQAHVMPFYHPDDCPDAYHFWPYFLQQLQFLTTNNKRPIFVSQTLWAYNMSGHTRGKDDWADNMDNYQEYWNTINDNCATFKYNQVSWFIHSYRGEPGLDMVKNDGFPVFNFTPKFC